MKAKIENIRKKFGVGGSKPEPQSKIVSEDYGYSSYTYEVYKNNKLIHTITTSDFKSWKTDTALFIKGQVEPKDKIKIVLTASYPDDANVGNILYEGLYEGLTDD